MSKIRLKILAVKAMFFLLFVPVIYVYWRLYWMTQYSEYAGGAAINIFALLFGFSYGGLVYYVVDPWLQKLCERLHRKEYQLKREEENRERS
jgi:hypothetical protein